MSVASDYEPFDLEIDFHGDRVEYQRIYDAYQRILQSYSDSAEIEQEVALLPPLISLCADDRDEENGWMNMRPLSNVLRHSRRHLKTFKGPGDSGFDGADSDFEPLIESLSLLSALENFRWGSSGYFVEGESGLFSPSFGMDVVLRALCKAEAPLDDLSICVCPSQPSIAVLSDILKTNLKKFGMYGYH